MIDIDKMVVDTFDRTRCMRDPGLDYSLFVNDKQNVDCKPYDVAANLIVPLSIKLVFTI